MDKYNTSTTEINIIKFAIDKIEEVRENINSENQENKDKNDLVMSILDIEEVLNMVSEELKTAVVISIIKQVFNRGGIVW